MKRNFDRKQQMLLFGRNEKKKRMKIGGKKCIWSPPFFILLNRMESHLLTHLCVKLPFYPYFKILIIKYMDKMIIV